MSYAIIRNEKYTKDQMIQLSPHNERHKQNYSNKDFFNRLGMQETKRYFKTAYEFICNYNNLGEENIISAVVHLDEETPHMHLVYIPVVDSYNKKGEHIRKISASEFWKGKNSYSTLQDSFYENVILNGFKLERGKPNPNRSYKSVEKFKEITNFYDSKRLKQKIEQEYTNNDIYTSMKSFLNYEPFTKESVDKKLLQPLLQENNKLMEEIKMLRVKIANIEEYLEHYKNTEDENNSLKADIQAKQSELDVLYNLIVRLNDEKELLIEKAKKRGIDLDNMKRGATLE